MDTLAGYEILAVLGEGGNAVVYRARRPGSDREVALKVLRRAAQTRDAEARFRREVQVLARLDCPRILEVLDAGIEERDLWYVMPYTRGESLDDVFDRRLAHGGVLEIATVMGYFLDLAEALAYLHEKGVIHRDLKPSNLLIEEDGRLKVMDFGLAKDLDRSELTGSGTVMGTPRFMSPEQVLSNPVLFSSDVYQAGLVIYQALTGKIPLEEDNPFATAMRRTREAMPPVAHFNPIVPPALDRILLKCLRYEPPQRYEDGAALLADLRALDPASADLLPGRALPGTTAEASVGERARRRGPNLGHSMDLGDGYHTVSVRGARPGDGPPTEERGAVKKRPDPNRRVALLLGACFGGLVVIAGILATRPGPAARPSLEVTNLLAEPFPGGVDLSFQTATPVRAHLRITTPVSREHPVSDEPRTRHLTSLRDLEAGSTHDYLLVLTGPDGSEIGIPGSFRIPGEDEEPLGKAGFFSDVEMARVGDGFEVRFRTDEPSECWARWGRREPLTSRTDADPTGGRAHRIALPDARPGEGFLVQIFSRDAAYVERKSAPTPLDG